MSDISKSNSNNKIHKIFDDNLKNLNKFMEKIIQMIYIKIWILQQDKIQEYLIKDLGLTESKIIILEVPKFVIPYCKIKKDD